MNKRFLIIIGICSTVCITGIGSLSFGSTPTLVTTQSDWGEWTTSDCLKEIDYRVKKGDFNSYANKWYWYLQFRNRYENQVHFSYSISEPGTQTEPDHRDQIDAGETSDTKGFLLTSGSRCHVRTGNLRFGDNDYGPYEPCDR